MKIEALLDAKDLFEDVIENEEPKINAKDIECILEHKAWKKKIKEAMGILVFSLIAEQAIIYKFIKKAKDIWNEIKLRFEGAVEDRKIDLMLELTSLKNHRAEASMDT
ncbi:hypothetical protein AVEN_129776-1 [Araneus ventricosus]|uniref:Retrovirus-related Pol polyprotein from transposon TNT 1-94 n=1 Tax=Araneus ventricosus TaxID=182803 RepID=A0A4Y2UWV9_ARAVE|nr:hypothetical protein AVEN_228315-1 [Araneus ventricosus]GBO16099.1 hypothetical protein AVEN_266990-1 [Araneus ventricosus]GBO16100.1 hypothetical protein AVEN_22950-1 [Araneus ventricosus]GBO16105.1 hypothetical protein AVEN_129776-1 [Araneus ventricosus]